MDPSWLTKVQQNEQIRFGIYPLFQKVKWLLIYFFRFHTRVFALYPDRPNGHGVQTLQTQDSSDPRHFGTSAEVAVRHFGTSAELFGHNGTLVLLTLRHQGRHLCTDKSEQVTVPAFDTNCSYGLSESGYTTSVSTLLGLYRLASTFSVYSRHP